MKRNILNHFIGDQTHVGISIGAKKVAQHSDSNTTSEDAHSQVQRKKFIVLYPNQPTENHQLPVNSPLELQLL